MEALGEYVMNLCSQNYSARAVKASFSRTYSISAAIIGAWAFVERENSDHDL